MDSEKELARLHDQLDQAKSLYDDARLEHYRPVELMRELGASHPDGSVRQATHAFTHALRNYRVALHKYNRFLLDHMSPSLEKTQRLKKRSTQV